MLVVVYNKIMCFYLNVCLVYIVCFCEKYIAKSLSLYIYLHLTLQYIGHRSNCLYAGIGCTNNLKLTLTTRWPPIIVYSSMCSNCNTASLSTSLFNVIFAATAILHLVYSSMCFIRSIIQSLLQVD